MPMMPCGCRKLQQRKRLCLRIPELAGNPPPSLPGCRWSLLILKCGRLMCSFNISLQHHKEDKHLGSKNTFFSDHPRRRKSDEWNYTPNGSPFILRCPPCQRSTVFTATPHLLQRYWYSYGNATLYYYNNINKLRIWFGSKERVSGALLASSHINSCASQLSMMYAYTTMLKKCLQLQLYETMCECI